MAEPSSTKLDPAAEKAADTEPQLAKGETELATKPKSVQEGEKEGGSTTTGSYSELASNATATATAAAAGVKDSVFSMFGGGAPKEKKPEPADDADEPSGSSKKKTGDEEEVSLSRQ